LVDLFIEAVFGRLPPWLVCFLIASCVVTPKPVFAIYLNPLLCLFQCR